MSQSQSVVPLLASSLGDTAHLGAIPSWLAQLQAEYRQQLAELGMPGPRSETWKYTSLRALAQRQFASHDSAAATVAVDPSLWQVPGLDGPALVFVNGVFRADLSQLDDLPAGLTLQPLSQALREDTAGQLQPLWAEPGLGSADVIRRLNVSAAQEGVHLQVAAGVKIEPVLRLVYLSVPAASAQAWHLRAHVELAAQASLRVLEQHLSVGDSPHLATLTTHQQLAEEANLEWVGLQQSGPSMQLFRHAQFTLAERAQAAYHGLELGAGLVRHELSAVVAGDAAKFDSRGVIVAGGRQHVDTQLQIQHTGKHSSSKAIWRGVADQRARVVFRGAIVVAEGADGTDAALANKNLLLSAQAGIDSKPELEIYADEVKAAHGATVGQLDNRALFYLRSRGIPLEQARRLLMAAFCQEVLAEVAEPALQQHVAALLLEQLPQAAG